MNMYYWLKLSLGVNFSYMNFSCITGYVLVPSIEKKQEVSEKELKRKELYVKITEAWQTALTRALKIEIAGGGVGKHLKYSKRRCKCR